MKGQLRIEKMYAFIVVDDDGSEGVPAFQGPDGMVLPMTGADLARVESLRPIAQNFANRSGKSVKLCVFENRIDQEVIVPYWQVKANI